MLSRTATALGSLLRPASGIASRTMRTFSDAPSLIPGGMPSNNASPCPGRGSRALATQKHQHLDQTGQCDSTDARPAALALDRRLDDPAIADERCPRFTDPALVEPFSQGQRLPTGAGRASQTAAVPRHRCAIEQVADKGLGAALDGMAAAPFRANFAVLRWRICPPPSPSRLKVRIEVDQPVVRLALPVHQSDGAQHPVAPAGQERQAGQCLRWSPGQDASCGDHRVGGQDEAAGTPGSDGPCLFGGHPPRIEWGTSPLRGLSSMSRRIDRIGDNAEPQEQRHAPWAGRGKDDGWPIRHAEAASFEAVRDPALGQIIEGSVRPSLHPRQNANAVLAHLSGRMAKNFMIVFEFHTEHRIWQKLNRCPAFQKFFLGHKVLLANPAKNLRVLSARRTEEDSAETTPATAGGQAFHLELVKLVIPLR